MIDKSKKLSIFLYEHSFVRYIFVGGTTFTLDFILLVLLHSYFNLNLEFSTTVSYWTAIAYNFTLNRQWTFSAKDKNNLHKHLSLYLVLLGFNYLFTLAFVSIGSNYINYALAKIIAVCISITWTYKIYKTRIFID